MKMFLIFTIEETRIILVLLLPNQKLNQTNALRAGGAQFSYYVS
jgi:hypothetical protein